MHSSFRVPGVSIRGILGYSYLDATNVTQVSIASLESIEIPARVSSFHVWI